MSAPSIEIRRAQEQEMLNQQALADTIAHFVKQWSPRGNRYRQQQFEREFHMLLERTRSVAQEPVLRRLAEIAGYALRTVPPILSSSLEPPQ